MAGPIVGIIGGAISAIGSIFGASTANKRARRAEVEKARLTGELDTLRKKQTISYKSVCRSN